MRRAVVIIAAAALLAAFLALRPHLTTPANAPTQPRPGVHILEEPEDPRASSAVPPARTEVPPPTPETVPITVTNVHGVLLRATVRSGDRVHDISGTGEIPRNLGQATVCAPGYSHKVVDVGEDAVRVELSVAYRIRGLVYDAVSGARLEGVEVVLRPKSGSVRSKKTTTDVGGEFEWRDVTPGEYLLLGGKVGYVPLCEGPGEDTPGVAVVVDSASLRLEIPMFPMWGALYAIQNETNLRDVVLPSIITTRIRFMPGVITAQYAANVVEAELIDRARQQGGKNLFSSVRTIVAPDSSPEATVDLFVHGEYHRSISIRMRSVAELMEDPTPELISVKWQWVTTEVRIETPVDMQLVRSGVPAGGIKISPGVSKVTLPVGDYTLRPRDVESLLDADEWTYRLRLPDQQNVVVGAGADFAMLTIENGRWDGGMLLITGEGRGFALWPHAHLPKVIFASPGSYRLQQFAPGGEGGRRRLVWSESVDLVGGQARSVWIGRDR